MTAVGCRADDNANTGAGEARHSLERALDWLADGVAVVRADGVVVYANATLQAIARRNDGIRLRKEIGRASCREREEKSVVAVVLKKKNKVADGVRRTR